MHQNHDDIITPTLFKNLLDKNEERHRHAKEQLQQIISRSAARNHLESIQNIIHFFVNKLLKASDLHRKSLGLQLIFELFATLHSFPKVLGNLDIQIVSIILRCLGDSEPKIRYTAIKTVTQIINILSPAKSIRLFNLIFERMIGCINDADQIVRERCISLNNTLESMLLNSIQNLSSLDFSQFVKILKMKLKTLNLQVRTFLIEWIKNIIKKLDLIVYLPDFLQDLLILISIKQLQDKVSECLNSFQTQLRQKFHDGSLERQVNVDFVNDIITILIRVAKGKHSSYTKLQVLEWFKIVLIFFKEQTQNKNNKIHKNLHFKTVIIERFDEVLEPILLLMSHEEEEVRFESINANDILIDSIRRIERQQPINFVKVVPILKEVLSEKKSTDTSEYAINWMKFMLENYNDKIIPQIKQIMEKLIEKIYESNLKNVTDIIQNTTLKEQYFELIIEKMIDYLHQHLSDNQEQIYSMMVKFITLKDSQQFCNKVCSQLGNYQKKPQLNEKNQQKANRFCYQIAANLSAIIVNQDTMVSIRKNLNNWSSEGFVQLFTMLFDCLKFNSAAIIILCFLSQQYELSFKILNSLIRVREISALVLLGLCKLVALIQKPAFLYLRLQILQRKYAFLMKSLNLLLMILPQGKIFNMLRNRLDSTSIIAEKDKPHQSTAPNISNPIDPQLFFHSYLAVYTLEF